MTTTKTTGSRMTDTRDRIDDWREIGVRGIARFWKTHMPESYQQARREFVRLVEPYVSYAPLPRSQDAEVTNMVFTEWLAYDYMDDGCLTPLEIYVKALEERGQRQASADLAQVACTQFFSEFWVVWQRPAERLSLVEDAFTRDRYLLSDAMVATNPCWSEGLLSLRLARVDDEWFDVGVTQMHDNYPSRADYSDDLESLVADHPEGAITDPSGRGISYLAFARQLLGPDGGYLPSLEIHHWHP